MRSRWFAVSSLVLCALLARAETRPHYGGVLRVETQETLTEVPQFDTDKLNALGHRVAHLLHGDLVSDLVTCNGLPGMCSRSSAGAFRVKEFLPGRKLTLVASDDCPNGRPYLDSIEITMGRAPRDQMLDLQLGRADVIDVPAESVRRASQNGMQIVSSAPIELIAIVFAGDVDARVRDALALSVDRNAIFNVLLGRQGEPTAALLPNWMTGYAFAFDASQDVNRARQLRMESRRTQPLTLTYDPQDGLARAIAERVALDARAAGLQVTPTTSIPNPDAKLVRILLPPYDPNQVDPAAQLADVAAAVGASVPDAGKTPEQWYAAERELRDKAHIIPIVHVPVAYGIGARVKNWPASKSGAWSLADVWLEQRP